MEPTCRPRPSRTAPRALRRAVAAAAVAVALAGAPVAGPAGAAPAPVAQEPGGTGTEPAVTTAPGATDEDGGDEDRSSEVDAENRRIWMVVGALVAVAVALTVLTVLYWRRTRPVPVPDVPARRPERPPALDDDDIFVRPERTTEASRMAVAGADHPTADDDWEPLGTGEHERVEVPAASRPTRPTRAHRAAALGGPGPARDGGAPPAGGGRPAARR